MKGNFESGIAVGDIRRMLRILGEVQQMSGEALAGWRCLLRGLCQLVRADVGMMARIANGILPQRSQATAMVEYGSPTDEERDWILHHFQPDDCLEDMAETETPGRAWTAEDGSDHCLFSVCRGPNPDFLYGVALYRRSHRDPFEKRDEQLIDLFYTELSWLYQRILTLPCDTSTALSPRLYVTLQRLMAGDSEKQVAYHLGLSHHTIHGYVKAIYRHFGVSSRGELFAHCVATTPYRIHK